MSIWFEGENEIACSIQQVRQSLEDLGLHYVGVVTLMPGMADVELVEQGDDFVTIRTNEGLMKRTNISVSGAVDSVVVEFDEEYQAGIEDDGQHPLQARIHRRRRRVSRSLVMSNVEASGVLGFFYRTWAAANMGKAFLAAYKGYLEQQ